MRVTLLWAAFSNQRSQVPARLEALAFCHDGQVLVLCIYSLLFFFFYFLFRFLATNDSHYVQD
jgi:hypothetical protein